MITNQTHKTNLRRPRRRGFTLTEIAIVLGIVGLILGSIWVAAAAVYNNMRVSHANTEILQIAQGVRTLYATTNTITPAGDITGALITAGVIPRDIANVAAGTANDPWANGSTNVLVPATNDSFTIQLTAVPQAPCIALLSTVAGSARDASLFAVGSTTASAPVQSVAAGGLTTAAGQVAVVTPVIAAAACSSVSSNTVQFGFGLK